MRTLVLAGLMAAAAPAALAQNVYVTADRMLDVTTGRMIQEPAIIMQDGVITQVGTRARLQVPSAAEVVELPGVTLLPGLIDMHVHLDTDPTALGYSFVRSHRQLLGRHRRPQREEDARSRLHHRPQCRLEQL